MLGYLPLGLEDCELGIPKKDVNYCAERVSGKKAEYLLYNTDEYRKDCTEAYVSKFCSMLRCLGVQVTGKFIKSLYCVDNNRKVLVCDFTFLEEPKIPKTAIKNAEYIRGIKLKDKFEDYTPEELECFLLAVLLHKFGMKKFLNWRELWIWCICHRVNDVSYITALKKYWEGNSNEKNN